MQRFTRFASILLLSVTFGAACAGTPMMLVPVDVDPPTTSVQVFLHEDLDDIVLFEPIRVSRTPAAGLLEVQCRLTCNRDKSYSGNYYVEFFDGNGRRLSSTNVRPWSMAGGAPFLIEARAGSADAESAVLSVR